MRIIRRIILYKKIYSEYWDEHHDICAKFYEDNLFKLTEKILLSGIKAIHSGCEFGFSDSDLKALTSSLS